jgi:hypothetical protein
LRNPLARAVDELACMYLMNWNESNMLCYISFLILKSKFEKREVPITATVNSW